jgi:hypothetical protein
VCYFRRHSAVRDYWDSTIPVRPNAAFQSMIVSVILLVLGFLTRFAKMTQTFARFVTRRIKQPIERFAQRVLAVLSPRDHGPAQARRRPFHERTKMEILMGQPLAAVFITFRLGADFMASMLMEICWLLAAVLWGTLKVTNSRKFVPKNVLDEESRWTIGQTMPILLLAGPVLSIVTAAFTVWKNTSQHIVPHDQTSKIIQTGSSDNTVDKEPGIVHAQELVCAVQSGPESLDNITNYKAWWLLPCLVPETVAILFSVGRGFVLLGRGQSFIEGWIQYGLVYFASLGVPLASSFSIAVGLAMDHLTYPPKPRKVLLLQMVLFFLSSGFHVSYAMVYLCWDYDGMELGPAQWFKLGLGLGLTAFICLMYCFGCVVLRRWSRSKALKSTD